MRAVFAIALASAAFAVASCSTVAKHPCTQGGQSARDDGKVGKGNKQCEQVKTHDGKFINHGKYIEWFPSGKRQLQGEYKAGVKVGKWSEWDEQGRLLNEKWYENGVEVKGREKEPQNGLKATPTSR
jgi:hypothetical protein